MNIGWKFNEKMRFDISGTNIFDKKYRSFPGMPVIGRRMLGKITYSF
jgi:outer membrane receptor protein involved in Fe transport